MKNVQATVILDALEIAEHHIEMVQNMLNQVDLPGCAEKLNETLISMQDVKLLVSKYKTS